MGLYDKVKLKSVRLNTVHVQLITLKKLFDFASGSRQYFLVK